MALQNSPKLVSLALGLLFLLALCLIPAAARANGEVEPNDTLETATGPLVAGATYGGVLSDDADIDNYYFYVTSPSAVSFTIADPTVEGGGVYTELLDAEGEVIDSIDVFPEDFDTLEAELDPGKYYLSLETEGFEQFDEAYEIVTAASGGGFAPPADFAAVCQSATAGVGAAKAALRRAERRLARARRGHSRARKARALRKVRAAKARLRAARAAQAVCA